MHWWKDLSLTQKFLTAAIVPIGIKLMVLGFWVSSIVVNQAVHKEASATALYIDSFIEPLLQEMASADELGPDAIAGFDRLIRTTPFSSRIFRLKIWNRKGKIVYSTLPELVGRVFPLTESLVGAFGGKVSSEFDDTHDEENETERPLKKALLEIYVPVRATGTDRIIAVAETYEIADQLRAELGHVRLETWLLAAVLTAFVVGVLLLIVKKGSATIERQYSIMQDQIAELNRLLVEVKTLRSEVDRANRRAAESTEHFIRRISSDLHDGPAQQIALALLLVEDLDGDNSRDDRKSCNENEKQRADKSDGGSGQEKIRQRIDTLLSEALGEIRTIAAGATPPGLEMLAPSDVLRMAVRNHATRTATRVDTDIGALPNHLSLPLKLCLYRFAQECLMNAYVHAAGIDQKLVANCSNGTLTVEISDGGPGFSSDPADSNRPRLGLSFMRDRVESLGGKFEIMPGASKGVCVRISFSANVGVLEDEHN